MKNGLFKNVAISAVSAELAAFVFLIVSAFLTYKAKDPDMLSGVLGISALIFGAMVCGALSAIIKCNQMLTAGIASTAVYTAMQFITAFFSPSAEKSASEAVIKAISVMLVSIVINRLISRSGGKRRVRSRSRR